MSAGWCGRVLLSLEELLEATTDEIIDEIFDRTAIYDEIFLFTLWPVLEDSVVSLIRVNHSEIWL